MNCKHFIGYQSKQYATTFYYLFIKYSIDDFQINEIIIDLRTSGFDNEVFSVDACAVWWERESFYCLPRISVEPWHREPRLQCGSARTGSIWNLSITSHRIVWTYIYQHTNIRVLDRSPRKIQDFKMFALPKSHRQVINLSIFHPKIMADQTQPKRTTSSRRKHQKNEVSSYLC